MSGGREVGEEEGEGKGGKEETGEGEVPRINVEIPRCVAHLGSEQYFVKLPNFLSVETRCVCVCVSPAVLPSLFQPHCLPSIPPLPFSPSQALRPSPLRG